VREQKKFKRLTRTIARSLRQINPSSLVLNGTGSRTKQKHVDTSRSVQRRSVAVELWLHRADENRSRKRYTKTKINRAVHTHTHTHVRRAVDGRLLLLHDFVSTHPARPVRLRGPHRPPRPPRLTATVVTDEIHRPPAPKILLAVIAGRFHFSASGFIDRYRAFRSFQDAPGRYPIGSSRRPSRFPRFLNSNRPGFHVSAFPRLGFGHDRLAAHTPNSNSFCPPS